LQQDTEMLRKQFLGAVTIMEPARDDVLTLLHFPQLHLRKIWSTNPLERLYVGPICAFGSAVVKRHTSVVSIFPCVLAILRLVGRHLLEQ